MHPCGQKVWSKLLGGGGDSPVGLGGAAGSRFAGGANAHPSREAAMNGRAASVTCGRGGGFGAGHADGLVDDGVEELVMVELGLGLDVGSGAAAGGGAVGECHVAVGGGDFGEFPDDLEEVGLVLAAENPGLMDGGGDDLVGGPVVRGVCVGDRHVRS